MENPPSLEAEVKDFIAAEVGARPERLSLQTSLNFDLGVDGDDAIELLANFSDFFNVDLSHFQFDKYFDSEGFNLFTILRQPSQAQKQPITLQDFVIAATSGRWIQA